MSKLRAWTIWGLMLWLLVSMVQQVVILNGWNEDPQRRIIMLVALIPLCLMMPTDKES